MRVLSVQQPQAQLIVRGLQRHVLRTWSTKYRGPIAIHASVGIPLFEIEREWLENYDRAREYASQGWNDIEDIRALPRQAIVGTVEVESVVLWRDAYQEFRRTFFEQDPDFGIKIHGALCVDKPDYWKRVDDMDNDPGEDWVWHLRNPVEIAPVMGVEGKRNLWTLDDDHAWAVSAAEQRSRDGTWRWPEVPASVQKKCLTDWLRAYDRRLSIWAQHNVVDHTGTAHLPHKRVFAEPEYEARFQKLLKSFVEEQGERRPRSGGDGVRLKGKAKELMGGLEWMRVEEFERELRKLFVEYTEVPMWRVPAVEVEYEDPRDRVIRMMKARGRA